MDNMSVKQLHMTCTTCRSNNYTWHGKERVAHITPSHDLRHIEVVARQVIIVIAGWLRVVGGRLGVGRRLDLRGRVGVENGCLHRGEIVRFAVGKDFELAVDTGAHKIVKFNATKFCSRP